MCVLYVYIVVGGWKKTAPPSQAYTGHSARKDVGRRKPVCLEGLGSRRVEDGSCAVLLLDCVLYGNFNYIRGVSCHFG